MEAVPAATSVSPKMIASRAFSLLAISNTFFSLPSAELHADSRAAQLPPRRIAPRFACASPSMNATITSGSAASAMLSSTVITSRSSPIENPTPGAGIFDPMLSASPSYRPPASTVFCEPRPVCVISNVVRM